jgi:hypothetical protein
MHEIMNEQEGLIVYIFGWAPVVEDRSVVRIRIRGFFTNVNIASPHPHLRARSLPPPQAVDGPGIDGPGSP